MISDSPFFLFFFILNALIPPEQHPKIFDENATFAASYSFDLCQWAIRDTKNASNANSNLKS